MRSIALFVAIAACSRSAEHSWWCTDSMCVATKDDCARMAQALHTGATCKPRGTAVCSHGCEQTGGKRLCAPTCAVDRETCEMDAARASSCREEQPPAHPELFPFYVEPGWWCGEVKAGAVSSCEKVKESCEDTLHVECRRTTSPVYCWSRRLTGAAAMTTAAGGKLAFVCTKTLAFCEQTLAFARASGSGEFEIASGCSVWPYD